MNSTWPEMNLRDICSYVEYGYTASASHETIGPKLLRITDIVPELINWNSVPYCQIEKNKLAKYLLHNGDIVVARTGATTGYAKRLKNPPLSVFASYLVRLKIKSGFDSSFIGSVVESNDYKQFIMRNIGGAAQPNANAQVLTSYKIKVPPLPIQRRIASILSAYDDLIENNTRRIAILEEMARRIYEEWFVHFRFPGHEKVKMVDSELGKIPEGWKVKTVDETFEIIGGGTPSKKEVSYWEDGTINWYSPTDLTRSGRNFMESSTEKITGLGLAKSSAKLFPPFSIMMTSRATIGAIAINTTVASTNQGFITCIPNDKFPIYLLFHWLKQNVSIFESLGTGATFKEIIKGVFRQIKLPIPSERIVDMFQQTVSPMMEQILCFERKNANLRTTRDFLLPKLISGEIDVSKLPEPEEAAA